MKVFIAADADCTHPDAGESCARHTQVQHLNEELALLNIQVASENVALSRQKQLRADGAATATGSSAPAPSTSLFPAFQL